MCFLYTHHSRITTNEMEEMREQAIAEMVPISVTN